MVGPHLNMLRLTVVAIKLLSLFEFGTWSHFRGRQLC
jgi:hypothetical protein